MVQFRLKVVLVAGLEPARSLERGILSPLRLPISPQQHKKIYHADWLRANSHFKTADEVYYTIISSVCQSHLPIICKKRT